MLRLAIALAAGLLGCADGPDDAPGIRLESATYVMRFDRTGLEPIDGRGFSLHTDRGYEVRVTGAYFLQHSMSLVDCEGLEPGTAPAAWRAVLPSIARAGHSDAPDPSLVDRPVYVDLVDAAGDQTFGSVSFPRRRYCRIHHLVGGNPEHLFLRGSFRVNDSTSWQSFRVASSLAWGDLVDIDDVREGTARGTHAEIVVERSIAGMLDGIDLATAEPLDVEIAHQSLRNLVGNAAVHVTLEIR